MSKFVEVNTDYIDENGVQHIDGYTSNSDDAEGCVVAYFVKGEAYYTNPDYRFDELIKATVEGLKLEYEKTAQSKYKNVIDTADILQINNNAISELILSRMDVVDGGVAFKDTDSGLNEKIYYGNVFQSILDNAGESYPLPKKFLTELNYLIELSEPFAYVMVTKI